MTATKQSTPASAHSIFRQLCYTRGTTVPLHLMLISDDVQALDLLSSIYAPDVRLTRTTSYGQAMSSLGLVAGDGSQVDQPIDLASARFTPAVQENSESPSTQCRVLRGELTIPGDIPPECHILHYSMEVSYLC